jgi:hypothetical protein
MVGNPGSVLLPSAAPNLSLPQSGHKEALSLQEASNTFGVSVKALEDAVKNGKLPAYELLGEKVVKALDLQMLMQPASPHLLALNPRSEDNGEIPA